MYRCQSRSSISASQLTCRYTNFFFFTLTVSLYVLELTPRFQAPINPVNSGLIRGQLQCQTQLGTDAENITHWDWFHRRDKDGKLFSIMTRKPRMKLLNALNFIIITEKVYQNKK